MWEAKDKRISFQSLFSSLCELYKGTTPDGVLVNDLEKMAYELNANLHKKYAYTEKPMTKNITVGKVVNQTGGVEIHPCPVCGKPMNRQYNKKNPKSPDWKCSDSNCKFTKAYGGGWRKGDYITGDWDPKPEDLALANHQDAIDDEAHKNNEHTDEDIPAEYR